MSGARVEKQWLGLTGLLLAEWGNGSRLVRRCRGGSENSVQQELVFGQMIVQAALI